MPRVLLATYAAALLALVLVGALHREHRAFTLGVTPFAVAAELPPGGAVCQAPIRVPDGARFDAVELVLGTYRRPGPPVAVAVRDAGGGELLARGELAAGYPDNTRRAVRTGPVAEGASIEVCVRNRGSRRVALYGSGAGASPTSDLRTASGEVLPTDLDLVFLTTEGRPLLALVPAVLQRATLFHGGLAPAWLLWLVLALLVVGVPLLLARALGRTGAAEAQRPRARTSVRAPAA